MREGKREKTNHGNQKNPKDKVVDVSSKKIKERVGEAESAIVEVDGESGKAKGEEEKNEDSKDRVAALIGD